MPTRYIKESARTSKNLDTVSDFAERLFWRLITTADDFGRFLACPVIVKSTCFPLRESMKAFKVEQALAELQKEKLIGLYLSGDRQYGWFVNWEKHQGKPRATASKYPDPSSDTISVPRHLHASAHSYPQPPTDSPGDPNTNTDTDTDLNPSSPNPKIDLLSKEDAEFEDVWRVYPRKVGKQAARKAWWKLVGTDRPAVSVIVSAIEKQRTWPQWTKDEGQFIPHLATWLNQHRWEDELMLPPPKSPRKPTSLVELL